ncbi:hypothetical protein EHW99_3231 [Erwinia amylovora]|uniref:Uncharacterized protein n=3 Tax=Erwinia amylovora TaxID=552 RepID=A0A831EIJ1_ERWAM|nr:hypothetical protein EaACW_0351 [Erwinia amylovora ACW56400]QJQ55930.1 hypothetical protein EHX00_3231 [Erwinia amylovora]CBA19287.1 hypothetical protein predicted by Glimmer/Critica [Erwinia amylovora CFBP1430]CBJ47749.1 hypothetical protein EAM_3075 [Erwinia amylovora ATCC 49946]CBX79160.1 hypothetical protein predicted by Glimmer/Critica [Erwinia amylovora ATCC BAA-2158]CCO77196.1 hypothetical protein BN432_0361 [Erwinia amylovora Ea356]CCO80979.1 hypothetical protein BN433_0370 [Erwini
MLAQQSSLIKTAFLRTESALCRFFPQSAVANEIALAWAAPFG